MRLTNLRDRFTRSRSASAPAADQRAPVEGGLARADTVLALQREVSRLQAEIAELARMPEGDQPHDNRPADSVRIAALEEELERTQQALRRYQARV